jgi:hypothetical protein
MLLLDSDDIKDIIKKVAILLFGILVLLGFTSTYYYGNIIFQEITRTKNETTNLKNHTKKLNQESDEIRDSLHSNTKVLKNSITSNTEDTKKVDSDVRIQTSSLKQLQQDFDKHRNETKTEINLLKDLNKDLTTLLKTKEQYLNEQIKLRDIIIEKNKQDSKIEMSILNDTIKAKEKELAELRANLNKEIEWRNKNYLLR